MRHEGGGGLRLPAGVDAYTYNPGFVPGTGLFRDTDPVSRADGGAYIDKGRVIPSSAESYDVEREEDLWRTADALCGVTTGRSTSREATAG